MIAGGVATEYIVATAIVMAATGANDKVNRAAAKTFGEKAVKYANIAGAIYMGYTAFTSGASAASAADSVGGVVDATGGLETAVESAANVGVAAPIDATGGLDTAVEAPGNFAPSTNAGARLPAQPAQPAQPAPAPAKPGALDLGKKAVDSFKGMDPRTQAALIQVGGGALSGLAAGKAQEAALSEQIANENRYRSGSGLTYWQKKPSYTPVGG